MTTLVGKTAPDFTTQAVLGNGEIVEDYNFSSAIAGKYAVLFFYPMDFTFVCPTELISLNNRIDTFRKLGVEVVGVSIDSHWNVTDFIWSSLFRLRMVSWERCRGLLACLCHAREGQLEMGVSLNCVFYSLCCLLVSCHRSAQLFKTWGHL